MEKKRKPLSHIYIYFAMSIINTIICIGVWGYVLTSPNTNKSAFTDGDVTTINEGWVDGTGNEHTMPTKVDVSAGELYSMTHEITAEMKSKGWLLFRTDHTYVWAYINGRWVYQFGDPNDSLWGKTPGSGWQLIPVGDAQIGQKITIVTRCPYDKYSGEFRQIYLGTQTQCVNYVFHSNLLFMILSILPILIGLGILIFPLFFTKTKKKLEFVAVALAFFDVGAWSFTESRTVQLFCLDGIQFHVQTVNFVSFLLFAPSVVVALEAMGYLKEKKFYHKVIVSNCAIAFFLTVLQIANVADFFETLSVVHVMMLCDVAVFVYQLFRNWKSYESFNRKMTMLFLVSIFAVFLLDMMDFYVWDYFGNGFFTRLDFVIFMLTSGGATTRRAFSIYTETLEKEFYAKLAYTDALTGFGNHSKFDSDAQKLKKGANRATVLCMDMNGLKRINDTLGHIEGDKALKIVSEEMRALFPSEDLYRMGGDEFSALCYNTTKEAVATLCEELNRRLQSYTDQFGTEISVAYGVVEYNGSWGDNLTTSIDEADHKMYVRKKQMYEEKGMHR